MPERVTIVEVGPRDGLQNEKAQISAADKRTLIERLATAGLPVIEAGAFVSPKWVPQMADTAEVLAGLTRRPGVRYPVLVPNDKGYAAARAANVDEIAVFAAASETFSQKNINCSIAESLERFAPVMAAAKADGVRVRGYVSCVAGCPYEGAIAHGAVIRVTRALLDMGCFEVSLGDTIGVGTPARMRVLLKDITAELPVAKLAAHFHDTYGQAVANLTVALDEGIRTFDSSVGGLGGCPYAPGAGGNVATEDVVYMLNGASVDTGVNLDEVVKIAWWVSHQMGREPVSKVAKAKKAVCSL
jgi:hydroxymethylglutaryl-CoA lyase